MALLPSITIKAHETVAKELVVFLVTAVSSTITDGNQDLSSICQKNWLYRHSPHPLDTLVQQPIPSHIIGQYFVMFKAVKFASMAFLFNQVFSEKS